jgi:hypothetical protein
MPIKRYHFYNNLKYIDYNLKQLPIPLRNKLFILCMRNFWRAYTPLTSVPPTWYASSVKQHQLLFNAKLDNIHFMHLPCNTLEENKTYILGCQCSYCIKGKQHIGSNKYMIENIKQYYDENYYYETVPNSYQGSNDIVEVIEYGHEELFGLQKFNPNYELRKTLQDVINGPPIQFK